MISTYISRLYVTPVDAVNLTFHFLIFALDLHHYPRHRLVVCTILNDAAMRQVAEALVWHLLRLLGAFHGFAVATFKHILVAPPSQHSPPSAADDASAIEVTYTLDGIIRKGSISSFQRNKRWRPKKRLERVGAL